MTQSSLKFCCLKKEELIVCDSLSMLTTNALLGLTHSVTLQKHQSPSQYSHVKDWRATLPELSLNRLQKRGGSLCFCSAAQMLCAGQVILACQVLPPLLWRPSNSRKGAL